MKNIKFLQMSIFCGWSSAFAVHNPAEQYNGKPSQVWIDLHSDRHTFGSTYIRIDIHSDRPTFRYKAFILLSCQHAFILCLPCLRLPCFSALVPSYVLNMTNAKLNSVLLHIAYRRSTLYISLDILYFQDKKTTEWKQIPSNLTRT